MKKLLLLTAMLSSVAMASSDTMNISATVIKPLTVEAEAMDFKKVVAGREATAKAEFEIKGEPNESITITIPEVATLRNVATKSSLEVDVKTEIDTRGALSLDDEGELEVDVTGTIVTATDTPTGMYEGELVARVSYN